MNKCLSKEGLMSFEVSKEIKERVEQLRRELAYHSARYYVYDSPEISDYE